MGLIDLSVRLLNWLKSDSCYLRLWRCLFLSGMLDFHNIQPIRSGEVRLRVWRMKLSCRAGGPHELVSGGVQTRITSLEVAWMLGTSCKI